MPHSDKKWRFTFYPKKRMRQLSTEPELLPEQVKLWQVKLWQVQPWRCRSKAWSPWQSCHRFCHPSMPPVWHFRNHPHTSRLP